MEIYLAGFNVDFSNIEILEKIKSEKGDDAILEELSKLEWTPETISASYARISRDPLPIHKLREKSRNEIEKSRKSNESIIFGMGHASIAEHAVFNFDVIDISRLVVEELETTRLASFTEKSQRYIKINNGYFIPELFQNNEATKRKYTGLMDELFSGYNYLLDKLPPYFLGKNPSVSKDSNEYKGIINLAKEDARYLLPISTNTQLGMTVNGRSLENVIRKLNASIYREANNLGKTLYDIVKRYSPSLIKYTEASKYEKTIYSSMKKEIGVLQKKIDLTNGNVFYPVYISENLEGNILAAIVMKLSSLDYRRAERVVQEWSKEKQNSVLNSSIKNLEFFDSIIREYEISDFIFNLTLSSSAFAQLKRHRMTTQIIGEYNPSLGVTIPKSIVDIGEQDFFMDKIYKVNSLYSDLKGEFGKTANYLLTNSHRRNVLLKCNLRELIHISRLRADIHAQWDIRELTNKMIDFVTKKHPFLKKVLLGKDKFTTR